MPTRPASRMGAALALLDGSRPALPARADGWVSGLPDPPPVARAAIADRSQPPAARHNARPAAPRASIRQEERRSGHLMICT